MAARSTHVIFENRTGWERALEKTRDHLDHGVWSDSPPDLVGDSAEWRSESSGVLTGTEGSVDFKVTGPSLSTLLSMHLHWNNPFVGGNDYDGSATPAGQDDGSGFSVGFFGPKRNDNDAEVTFVLLKGRCSVDANTGDIASAQHHYAGVWEKVGGPAFEARHNLSAAQYQQSFDQLRDAGFRLVRVTGYGVNGQPRFGGVWEKKAGPDWQARHGLDAAQYQQTFDRLLADGFRPIDVCGYTIDRDDRYVAVWEKNDGREWQARHRLNAAAHQAAFDDLAARGFRLTRVSGYSLNGEARYASIWEKNDGRAWRARHGLDSAEYQREFTRQLRDGFRLVHVSGYSVKGQDRYAAIWEKNDGRAWQGRHNLNAATYQQTFDQLIGEGFRLAQVSGYGVHI